MDTKIQKKSFIPEPNKFIVVFETPTIRRKGIDAAADIGRIFLRKDGSAVLDKEQLEKLNEMNIPFKIKSVPPKNTTKKPDGELVHTS